MSLSDDLSIFDFQDPEVLCRRMEGVTDETPLSELCERMGLDLDGPGMIQIARFARLIAMNAYATRQKKQREAAAREREAAEPRGDTSAA